VAAAQAAPELIDVTALVGVTHEMVADLSLGGAVAIFDFDGDGRPDLLFTDEQGPCHLYRNQAGGTAGLTFVDVSDATGISQLCNGASAAVALDYDRDGAVDLAIAGSRGVTLLRNQGGQFRDVTGLAGLGGEWGASSLSAADLDRDGYPELYVGRYIVSYQDPFQVCGRNLLYRNRGDGTFEDLSAQSGADDPGCTLATSLVDVDGDGELDLVVANDFGNLLPPGDVLRGQPAAGADPLVPEPRFSSMGPAWGADLRIYGMGIATGDVDGDGLLDLYVTNIGRNVLLRGLPGGGFVDDTERFGLGAATFDGQSGWTGWRVSWGTALLDLDADGQPELYVGSGYLPSFSPLANPRSQPNLLFTGQPAGGFGAVAGQGGEERVSRGLATGDLDGDGLPDVVVVNVGGTPAEPTRSPTVYLGSAGAGGGGQTLAVTLQGTVSDPVAAGARVWVTSASGPNGAARVQMRDVDSGGTSHGSQHDATLLFGLGSATSASGVRVRWPSGITTEHGPLAAGARYPLVEPAWLKVPARMRAASSAELEVTPLLADGSPAGAGQSVVFRQSGGGQLQGAVQDLGDGRYRQTYQAPSSAGTVRIGVQVGGTLLAARPRILVAASDATVMSVPGLPLLSGQTATVVVEPRDADGNPLGAGHTVALAPSAGTAGAAVDTGDGTYRIPLTAPDGTGTDPLVVGVTVDGVAQSSRLTLPVVAAFDGTRSSVTVSPALAAPGDTVTVLASLNDGAGRPSPLISQIGITASAGNLSLVAFPLPLAGVVTQILTVPDGAPAEIMLGASVAGVALGQGARVTVQAADQPAPVARIDAASSRAAPLHTVIPADGRSRVRVFAAVSDGQGSMLRGTPGTTFDTTLGTWAAPSQAGLGFYASRCLVAPSTPGEAVITATVSGVTLAGTARIRFHAAVAGDPPVDGCGDDLGFSALPGEGPDGGAGDAGGDGSVADAGPADAGVDAGVDPVTGGPDDGVADLATDGPPASDGASTADLAGGGPGDAGAGRDARPRRDAAASDAATPPLATGGCSALPVAAPGGQSPFLLAPLLLAAWLAARAAGRRRRRDARD
jgi:hypothetical protein